MEIPVLRHAPHAPLGLLAGSLDRAALPFRYCDVFAPDLPIDAARAPAIIALGGPHSVNSNLPGIRRARAVIAQAIDHGRPVLGLCLGAQLLASVLGAKVRRIESPEIGWFPVRAEAEAASDPLFHDWRTETVFHWHNEGFDLPRGAVWLASSGDCRHQAFRYGDRHWGLQFHLEVTPRIIATWCDEDDSCGAGRERTQPIDPAWNASYLESLARRVFDRWAAYVKELPCKMK